MEMKKEEDAFRKRETQQFLRLMSLNQSKIYGYTLSLVSQKADADDLMQEISLTMWEKFDTFEQGTNFVAWGIQIARYKVANFRRKHYGKHKCILSDNAVQLLDMHSEKVMQNIDHRIDALEQCIKKLQPNKQEMIRLRYKRELSVEAIADRYGRRPKSIYKALAQIQDSLLRCIRLVMATE